MGATDSGRSMSSERNAVRISPEASSVIRAHGEQAYPEECCGLLLGSQENGEYVVEEVVEIDNSQGENRRRRFLITPPQYSDAERTASLRNRTLLGFYHSHPDHPAIPSQFDTDHALPWFVYVIVSVQKGEASNVSAWILEEHQRRFTEASMLVGSPAAEPAGKAAPGS